MENKRKRYNSEFKAKVALEALKEQKTINELSSQYGLHGNQITNWKKHLKENANAVFEKDGTNKNEQQEQLIERLYTQIGQLQVELDWLKKNLNPDLKFLRSLIEIDNKQISINRQCQILGIHRSGYYYEPVAESELNLKLMRLIDEQFLRTPFYGIRRMHQYLMEVGYPINHKRIERLYKLMGLMTIYPKPKLSIANKQHEKYPYLLKNMPINYPNQVWSTDITYIPMEKGFLYLVAVIDWYSRYVLSWRLSNSLDNSFCIEALQEALEKGKPEIFNTDQGVQFTSNDFLKTLTDSKIQISMDSKGRALDNIFVERLWRNVKYEYVYLNSPKDGREIYEGLKCYFCFYNTQRPHQSLDYEKPINVWKSEKQKI